MKKTGLSMKFRKLNSFRLRRREFRLFGLIKKGFTMNRKEKLKV